jgi:cobalamin biosynthesis protein CbiG
MERMRGLLEKLTKEEETQRKKYNDTLSAENLKKLEVDILHSNTEKGRESIFVFAEQFVQVHLGPLRPASCHA